MSVALSQLAAQQLGSSATVLFTVPSGNFNYQIVKATFTNTDSSSHAITVYIVPPGQTASVSNTIIAGQSVGSGACYVSPELPGHVLPPGYSLQALATSANVLTAIVSGIISA